MHVTQTTNFGFTKYIFISSSVITIYYILKAILVYTKDKRNYLKNLSDIREIVDIKPTKKQAKKREKK